MSIETRTQQNNDDIAPEGREPDARQNVPSQVAYDQQVPNSPDDDALPLDGSLTWSDSEPEDQTQRQTTGPRLLSGSESGATANAAIEGGAAADNAIDANDASVTAASANPDPSVGQIATGGQ